MQAIDASALAEAGFETWGGPQTACPERRGRQGFICQSMWSHAIGPSPFLAHLGTRLRRRGFSSMKNSGFRKKDRVARDVL